MNIKNAFMCPDCGGHRVEEIMSNTTVSTEVATVAECGDTEYGEDSHSGGVTDRFQCLNCGYALPCEPDTVSLYEFLVSSENKTEQEGHNDG